MFCKKNAFLSCNAQFLFFLILTLNLINAFHGFNTFPTNLNEHTLKESLKENSNLNKHLTTTQQPNATYSTKPFYVEKSSQNKLTNPENEINPSKANSAESTIRIVQVETGEPIRLRCRIPAGPYVVIWNKVGVEYPLSVGPQRFAPDNRISVRYKAPDQWKLIIRNAKLTDTGVYSCTTSSGDLRNISTNNENDKPPPNYDEDITEDTTKEYYVTVVEPPPSERFQVDAPAVEHKTYREKTITVTGPKLVFYGTPLELICRASFPSAEAKRNPHISLEWYHRGIRRRSNPLHSGGGVFITERWLDSHLLESRLVVAWASEAEAGRWICLDRSMPEHRSNRDMISATDRLRAIPTNHIQLSPVRFPSITPMKDAAVPTTSSLVFDRIDVEIIDIPDPTAQPINKSVALRDAMPAFAIAGIREQRQSKNPQREPKQSQITSWFHRPSNSAHKRSTKLIAQIGLLVCLAAQINK